MLNASGEITSDNCIMLECPYCPSCKYGFLNWHNFDPAFPEWVCLYDPARDRENKTWERRNFYDQI